MKIKDLINEIKKAEKSYLNDRSSHCIGRTKEKFLNMDVIISMDLDKEEGEGKRCFCSDYYSYQINDEISISFLFDGYLNFTKET